MEQTVNKIKQTQLFLNGPKLTQEQANQYDSERNRKNIGNIRFANILAIIMVAFFGILDFSMIADSTLLLKLMLTRILFIVAIIFPFYLLSFKKLYINNITTMLFLNTLSYIVFLHVIAIISNQNMLALLHVYIGLLIVIISLHLLLGLQAQHSLLLTIVSLVFSNIVILSLHLNTRIPFPIYHLNIWFIGTSLLALVFGLYFESLAKQAFLTNFKLKEENALKNKFFSVVAHDLKNLIASQYSIAEFLKENHYWLDEKKRDQMLQILNKSTSNVMEVFDDLMQWIKAQLDTIVIHNQATSIKSLTDTIVELMHPLASSKQITININLFNDFKIVTDANLLGLIMRNILGNAIKFSPDGSEISLVIDNLNDVTEIQIQDKGIGMSQDLLDSVFKLERIDSKPGTNGELGTGLGLILSKELMTVLKGELIIESYLSKGTTVSLIIPNS